MSGRKTIAIVALAALIIATIVVLGLVIAVFVKIDQQKVDSRGDVTLPPNPPTGGQPTAPTAPTVPPPTPGTTPGWKDAAKMFLTSINESVNPCQDFFAFSCDNYIKSHPLGNASSVSTFGGLQATINANLTLAINGVTDQNPSKAIKTAKLVYDACRAVDNSSYPGAQVLMDIAGTYGGWPLLDSKWVPAKMTMDLYGMMGDMFGKYGVSTLFSPTVGVDWRLINKHSVFLEQATLAIPAAFYKNSKLTERYQRELRNSVNETVHIIAERTGLQIDEPALSKDIDNMVLIEVQLANISVDAVDQRNASRMYNPYAIEKAQSDFAQFNWTAYFNGMLKPLVPEPVGPPQSVIGEFILAEPVYAQRLNIWLQSRNTDDNAKRDLVNYLVFRAISPYMQFAGDDDLSRIHYKLRHPEQQHDAYTIIDDPDTPQQRQQTCLQLVVTYMPYVAGRLYVDSSFQIERDRNSVSVMINDVLTAFSGALSGLRWIDDKSTLLAFQKVNGLVRNVAFPDFQQNDAQLDQHYNELTDRIGKVEPTDKQKFLKYIQHMVWNQGWSQIKSLNMSTDRTDFLMSPAVVNAWYQPERNSITFLAAILNQPFFRYEFPQAVNYGGIGVVMGHELSHGFDDEGIQYDWDGRLNTWMTGYAQTGFTSMAQCVVDEYNKFCYPQACVNGITTQGENIGDNGGIKASFRAYRAWTSSHGEQPPLPDGMEKYTQDQLFFMSFAQVWCGSYSEDALTRLLLTNPHSPGRDRVIGAVRNMPEFARAFNCKVGDPMVPTDPCVVW